jgi:hypothetical protein
LSNVSRAGEKQNKTRVREEFFLILEKIPL